MGLIGKGSRRRSYCDGWRVGRGLRVRILLADSRVGDSHGWNLCDEGGAFERKSYRCFGNGRRCGT